MAYFYDYFAKEYREGGKGKRLLNPVAICQGVSQEEIRSCRKALKNAFAGYREGRNAEALKRLLRVYREYVSCCHDGQTRDRYNAFVYRYMVEVHVGSRAIAAKMGVSRETVGNYVNRCVDEMLVLCMGVSAAGTQEGKKGIVRMLVNDSRLFHGMAGEYVFCLFPGKKQRAAIESGRLLTNDVMGRLDGAVGAYCGYCNDGHTCIDTEIRKAEILRKCLDGVPPAAIAEEYGVAQQTKVPISRTKTSNYNLSF